MDSKPSLNNLEALYSILKLAVQAKDLPALWGPLLAQVLAVLKVDAGSLMILEGELLVRKAACGLGDIMKEPPIASSQGGISWHVIQTRQPVVITDLDPEKIASQILKARGFRSLVSVPMLVREQAIGVMSIFTKEKHQFTKEELDFFTAVAEQAALAIVSLKSAELIGENRRRLSELEALNQISKNISTLFDFKETLSSILASITKICRAERGTVVLFDHESHLLQAVSPAYALSPREVADFHSRHDEGVTGQVFCKGIPIMAGKIDSETEAILKRARIEGIKSTMAAPLKVKSQSLGVIQIFSTRENNFNWEDLRLFSILASQAAIVVSSSTMYRAIEEERKKDEALLTSIGDGVLALDKEQNIIHFNPAAEKITGFSAKEILKKQFSQVMGLYRKAQIVVPAKESPLFKVLEEGKPLVSKDYYLKKKDGRYFPVELSLAAIYDVNNQVVGAIVVFRDISYEFELEQMKQELISLATHELRAPITAIKGYLDMVLSGDTGGVSGETAKIIQEVAKINQQLADLVDDLLNVGRIEQGRMTMKLQKVDLSKLIAQAVKEYQILAEDKHLTLKFTPKPIPEVKADPVRLRQVLNNLLSNAIKYTLSGTIAISVYSQDKEVVCAIKDTGVGIGREAQKKLFQKFYRVKTAETIQITGTGLGLWISKKLIEMMKGKIWLESEEGKGSTFYFSIPRA